MGSTLTTTLAAALLAAAPLCLHAWSPGVGNASATTGFTVDTQARNDVISFWHNVYMESEGYENRINWTGSVTGGTAGTTSAAFKDDVQRRINFYRAMAGLNANIDLTSSSTVALAGDTPAAAKPTGSTTKQEAAQAAALMLSRQTSEFLEGGGVANGSADPHEPPSGWSLDTAVARNGAFHSNLAVGHFGPGAIDAYISENDQGAAGGENNDAGHRRMILQTRLQELASGDTPYTSTSYYAANALYVSGNLLPSAPVQFVAWPNAGYIPEAITPERWSLSYSGADFSNSSVSMTDQSGSPVSVTVVSANTNYGESSIVWKPESLSSATLQDQLYNVTVSNIDIGGSMVSHNYQVVIINPNRLLESTDVFGSTSPPDSGANYFFNHVEKAEEYQFDISTLTTATWFEGAENGTTDLIIDETETTYDLFSSVTDTNTGQIFWDTGSKAFRLAFPRNEYNAFQSFQIGRTIIPRSGGQLKFRLRRGYMTPNAQVDVQTSTNGGGSWTTIGSYSGRSDNETDTSFSSKTLSLTTTDQDTVIRFILHQPANSGVYSIDNPAYNGSAIGAFIDGIETINCDELASLPPVSIPSSADFATLDVSSVGAPLNTGQPYTLRIRARMGNHWFSYGSSLEVTPVDAASLSDYELWLRGQYAVIGSFSDDYDQDGVSNAIERLFGLNPVDPNDAQAALTPQVAGEFFQITHPIISGETIEAEYSTSLLNGSWSPASVSVSGGIATASVPISGGGKFLRWKVTP
ncbi:hypothetical protein JIN77_05030 [Verrucomicrobiaceae bacterium R5-34]|nr:hypothetical protein [Verrucomicrobiaceae bacterium R5-34]